MSPAESAADRQDRVKAAGWALLAAATHGALLAFGHEAFPFLRNLLIGPAYALLLPAVAYLHVRDAPRQPRGALLGTLTGVAALLLGASGIFNVDAQPAGMFALGMWWWTVGKMWALGGEGWTRLGAVTAGAGALLLPASLVAAGLQPLSAVAPGVPDLPLWDLSRVALVAWSATLGVALWRSRPAA